MEFLRLLLLLEMILLLLVRMVVRVVDGWLSSARLLRVLVTQEVGVPVTILILKQRPLLGLFLLGLFDLLGENRASHALIKLLQRRTNLDWLLQLTTLSQPVVSKLLSLVDPVVRMFEFLVVFGLGVVRRRRVVTVLPLVLVLLLVLLVGVGLVLLLRGRHKLARLIPILLEPIWGLSCLLH